MYQYTTIFRVSSGTISKTACSNTSFNQLRYSINICNNTRKGTWLKSKVDFRAALNIKHTKTLVIAEYSGRNVDMLLAYPNNSFTSTSFFWMRQSPLCGWTSLLEITLGCFIHEVSFEFWCENRSKRYLRVNEVGNVWGQPINLPVRRQPLQPSGDPCSFNHFGAEAEP